MVKQSKATIKRRLDAMCREIVLNRDRYRCQLVKAGLGPCGGHLQACHIYGKGAHGHMRYEPDNVITGCWRHHAPQSPASWHSNPMVYVDWFRAEYPARAERLRLMSHEQKTQRDLKLVEAYLSEQLKKHQPG